MSPQRIQLRRTKGWRKPEGAIVVSRPSRWGNPFAIVCENDMWDAYSVTNAEFNVYVRVRGQQEAQRIATDLFRKALLGNDLTYGTLDVQLALSGHDLGCWCREDWGCHADVLLEVANS